jgi:hypothetical protein
MPEESGNEGSGHRSPFGLIERILYKIPGFKQFEHGVPLKAKILIAVLVLVSVTGGSYTAFNLYDFTQNDPKFCVSCHIMQEAFETWERSEHSNINCHECHQLTIPEANHLLFSFIVHSPEKVPDRHGKVIVPWKNCTQCHWEVNERFPQAEKINDSRLHARHYFMEQVECSKCHGYKLHEFMPEERFCLMCHEGKIIHGNGMEELACLNCHTEMEPDLRPNRAKCLLCHGTGEMAECDQEVESCVDLKYFSPDQATVDAAIKINIVKDSPMQFSCDTCHHPHEVSRPDWGNCLDCHRQILMVGAHGLHIQEMGLDCSQCHKPHLWRVTDEQAKITCTVCHEYRSPAQYLRR